MLRETFWEGKSVWITGATSGIGRALAGHLAPRGARLGLIARREDVLDEVARSLRAGGGACAWAAADVADAGAVAAAAETLQAALGPCDVLVANAGIYRKSPVREFDPIKAQQVIATNLQGTVNAIAAVLPDMTRRRSGHIAAVASIAALVALPAGGVYRASKAAIVALADSLRVDLHPLGIRVTLIGPGFVDTPMITDRDRETVKNLVTAEDAARRIALAIRRGQAECWFPRSTWLLARAAGWLPQAIYRRIMSGYAELEEV
ncbi:MAG: SDR family NAD(P)-dependent oxidoreductase [Thermoguttaceae bacterium]|jgi:short-subunit dehydrogenase